MLGTAVAGLLLWTPAGGGRAADPPAPPFEPVPDDPLLPPVPGPEQDLVEAVMRRFPRADHKAVMEFIRQQFPHEMRKFRELSVKRFDEARALMISLVEEAMELLEARYRDPDLFAKLMQQRALERQTIELAGECRQAVGEARQSLLRRLEALLAETFEAKQELMRRELDRMEQELGELRDHIRRREARREAVIERRLNHLLGAPDELEW